MGQHKRKHTRVFFMNFSIHKGVPVGKVTPNIAINADCLEAISCIPDSSIDMIVCDPPYG